MKWLSPGDPSSFSRPDECLVKHIHLNLTVDFTQKVLLGSVRLGGSKVLQSAKTLVLDTRDLVIISVKDAESKATLDYVLGEADATFGAPLTISLADNAKDNFSIVIDYSTSPQCTALQWMTPEQTAGKKHPYLFSQCQAIHARSMLPCQDTPAVKTPYSATLHVPSELEALMSAIRTGSHKQDSGMTSHHFEQKVVMPSYLIAIVVGALQSRQIGPRSTVWTEKEMLEESAYEFAETEKMLSIAEELMGPYVWGIYDLLVLPPSFPYGGMENPCLTFITPTLLAGDRSLSLVVAHEISHSWTGNLVTNRNPEHFWLNEGHTVFVERKIAGRMMNESFRHMLALGGWNNLKQEMPNFRPSYTQLVPDLTGVDPDDAFSIVPYEKGSALLMYLEQMLGGPAVFEPFLKAYINEFKFKSIVTDEWKDFLYKFFSDKKSILDDVEWSLWLNSPGMPPSRPSYDTSLTEKFTSLAKRWSECNNEDLGQFTAADLASFSPYQVKDFLGVLLETNPLTSEAINKMADVYSLNSIKNCDIKFRWIRLCLRAHIEASIERALEFVNSQGRLKYVRPVYRDLFNWEVSRQRTVDNYNRTKSQMHPLTASMIGKDLQLV